MDARLADALIDIYHNGRERAPWVLDTVFKAARVLRATAEAKPVAWMVHHDDDEQSYRTAFTVPGYAEASIRLGECAASDFCQHRIVPLYTAPIGEEKK